jgi:hypothetical protein
MIVPEMQQRSKERHSCCSNYCRSDSRGRRRDSTVAAAIHSSRRIGCHPDWRFRSSGTPCSPSSSEQEVSLDECLDEGQYHHAWPNACRGSVHSFRAVRVNVFPPIWRAALRHAREIARVELTLPFPQRVIRVSLAGSRRLPVYPGLC